MATALTTTTTGAKSHDGHRSFVRRTRTTPMNRAIQVKPANSHAQKRRMITKKYPPGGLNAMSVAATMTPMAPLNTRPTGRLKS
jgi:hypothetical protein